MWLLVVGSDDDSLDRHSVTILTFMIVAAKPHLDLATVNHLAAVVPGHAVAGSQDEPVRYESSTTGPPSHASPGTSKCGLNKGNFYPCRSGRCDDFPTLSLAIHGQEWGWATTPLNTLSVA